MASTIINAPSNVGATMGLDCQTYVGPRPSINVKSLNRVRISIKANRGRRLAVRASQSHNEPFEKLGLSDADCEAAVVAGNVPEAPPVPPKPKAPAGTPVVPTLVSKITDFVLINLLY